MTRSILSFTIAGTLLSLQGTPSFAAGRKVGFQSGDIVRIEARNDPRRGQTAMVWQGERHARRVTVNGSKVTKWVSQYTLLTPNRSPTTWFQARDLKFVRASKPWDVYRYSGRSAR